MKKKLLIVLTLLALVVLTCNLSTPTPSPPERRGGEILWQEGSLMLYRCGPDKADICFDDGVGITKVYVGD